MLLGKGLADDRLEILGLRAPEVAEVDLVVLAPQLPTTLLYATVDPLYGWSLFGEGAEVHDLRRKPLPERFEAHPRDGGETLLLFDLALRGGEELLGHVLLRLHDHRCPLPGILILDVEVPHVVGPPLCLEGHPRI